MKNISRLLAAVLIAACITSGARAGVIADAFAEAAQGSSRESDLYERGTDAIDDEEWESAIDSFTRVAQLKGSRTDGALYWTAYALYKLKRRGEALRTIDVLKKEHPKSRWINDAKALEVEVRQNAGERIDPQRFDDETKLIAIQSLMHTDPEKAYPLLEKIVNSGTASRKMKEQALFVLSQSASPKAQALISAIAKGNANPAIQKDAIRYLAIAGGQRNAQLLAEVYASGASIEVRKEVLQSYIISGNKAGALAAARSETDPRLREKAINVLGIMGARAELAQMYTTETSAEAKKDIIQALFIAGDSAKIGELAQNERDPKLRAEAIRKLGLMGGKTAPAILALYAGGDANVKDAAIDALFVQGNSRALIDLARKESDRQMKRQILQKLSVMNDDDAVAYMLEILED